MSGSTGSEILIDALENGEVLEGRYSDLRLINGRGDARRGVFSLVFVAWDRIEEQHVAVKFFDPDVTTNSYRLDGFYREHALLKTLVNKKRCLQVMSGLKDYSLAIPSAKFSLPCKYFVVEWLEFDIESFFWSDDRLSPEQALRIFHDLVLSVEALHRHDIAHRDLKPDNLRARNAALKRIIVAIDLGTAARLDSTALKDEYDKPVGAKGYAPVEAFVGFAGDREIGEKADAFALGCMLWELFNEGFFFKSGLLAHNTQLSAIYQAIHMEVHGLGGATFPNLNRAIDKYSHAVNGVRLTEPDCTVPPGVAPLVEEVIQSLTNIDYRKRMALDVVRSRVLSAIRVVANERLYQKRLAERRERRENRRIKNEMKAARLREAMDCRAKDAIL
ncbi:protein kinase family protein [Algiphilus sp.]|uniref:protein kinase family protein n=1 Tax=Algiphilus sp. TaxID=1872431 RepID=UPI0025BFC938|nr:protein kinase family protein [Algiphilus sp.]MCK5771164.1 protein kinase family protein [Algiphilus sp.]